LLLMALCVLGPVASVRADEIKLGGTGAALATMQLLAGAYARVHPETRITVLRSLGSGGGIKAVLSGNIQMAVSARELTQDEIRQGAQSVEYGHTPLVFATSSTNKASALTPRELADIYTGKIGQWPDGQKIRLVLRPVGDTDTDMVKSLSAEMRAAHTAAEQRKGLPFAVSDQAAADSIEKIPGALGVSTLAQILSEKRALKALPYNGAEPSVKNVANGSYPLYKRLYLVTSPHSPPAAKRFIAFVQSPAGRGILLRTGHETP